MKYEWTKTQIRDAQIFSCDHKLPAIPPVTLTGLRPEGGLALEIFDALHGIHGIQDVACNGGYNLEVQKGRVFSWDEVKPRVEAALKDILEPSDEPQDLPMD